MATITGLTAARMLDIEANSIVEGVVNGAGRLILTTHNGVDIDAGSVRGADASSNISPKLVGDLPSSYPHGVTQFAYTTTTGWPTATGTVFTFMESIARGFQIVSEKGTSNIWFRTVAQDAWSAFYQIATKSYVDTQISTLSTARLDYLDGVVKGIELAGGVDLNTMKSPGVWSQSQNAEAASGLNYPVPLAGMLEVMGNGVDQYWQTYTPYSVNVKTSYKRTYYSGAWSAWYSYGAGEIKTNLANLLSFTGYGAPFPTPYVIRKGDLVILPGTMFKRSVATTFTITASTDTPISSANAVPSGWGPSAALAVSSGLLFNGAAGQVAPPSTARVNLDGSISVVSYGTTVTMSSTNHWIQTPTLAWIAGQ